MTGAYTVHAGDSHFWVEIKFRVSGWVAFDSTPRSDIILGSGTGQGWVSFGLLDYTGVNFMGDVSSLTADWLPGRLSLPS